MPSNPYYNENEYRHNLKLGTIIIPIYQPTTEGLFVLCAHYREKYGINLQCIDLVGKIDNPHNIVEFFTYIQKNPDIISTANGETRGFIMTHGAHHAIPVLIHQRDDQRYMVVFDSSSGNRIHGYFKCANLFVATNTIFYLNSGTRQSDGASCITDAICVLKEALLLENLLELINNKVIEVNPRLMPYQGPEGYKPLKLNSVSKPDHFRLFNMPEQLLLTAQRPAYLIEANADPSVPLRGGKSLDELRSHFALRPTLSRDEPDDVYEINSFLFLKGAEFKAYLDYVYEEEQQHRSDSKFLLDTNSPSRCSPSRCSPTQTDIERITSPFKTLSGLTTVLVESPFRNTSGFFPVNDHTTTENRSVKETSLASPSR